VNKRIKTGAVVLAAAGLFAVGGVGTATAAKLITGNDIARDTVTGRNIASDAVGVSELTQHVQEQIKLKAKDGKDGKDGKNGVAGIAAGAGYADWPTENPHHSLWAANSYGETIQTCKAGEYAVGGGFSSFGGYGGKHDGYDLGGLNTDVEITVSAPYFPGDYAPISDADSRFRPTQWVVRGFNHGDAPVDVRAWVTCTTVN
jgi:hypothetical protein